MVMQSYIKKTIEISVPVDTEDMERTFAVMKTVKDQSNLLIMNLPPGTVVATPMRMENHRVPERLPMPQIPSAGEEGADTAPGEAGAPAAA